jgi:hypothetical protein
MSIYLPTANNFLPGAVGRGDGGVEGERGERSAAVPDAVLLDPPREDMRLCSACESVQCFVAEFEIGNGMFGHCVNCGDERVVPFTRTPGEAA